MFSGRLTHATVRVLDRLAAFLPKKDNSPAHLQTGRRGEEDAYFYLRRRGYVVVARNFRSPRRRGEIDIIAWHTNILCFVEVKTRTTHDIKPAEAAVDRDKKRDLSAVAREYLRHLKEPCECRFDILSVYYEPTGEVLFELFQDAFRLS